MELKAYENNNGLVFENVQDFELSHTFDCGQCFRWNRIDDGSGSYIGVVSGRVVKLLKLKNSLQISGATQSDCDFWLDYLDLRRDYGSIKNSFLSDAVLAEAVKYGHGMRILNQDQFEIIISFIISANKQLPMIKRTVENISEKFGKPIVFEGKTYYSFPTPEELAKATILELRSCGCGYRAEYIANTSKHIANGDFVISEVMGLELEAAHKALIGLSGVGPKVADCILLFSMNKTKAFPVDVWVKRVMQYFYTAPDLSLKRIREYGMDKFGEFAGIAQQYLFYYARDKRIGT